ncbi:MAG: carboxypeptidase-like regulatory domain-containing protein, partial [Halobacteriales archaeon]|nr:carboxypeptidase-like regulatory domain-containing protein [Halobacteriales archaeon]
MANGSVSGKVTAGDGGAELEGITVSIYSDTFEAGAETDASGDFFIDEIPPGSYTVYFEDFGGDYVSEFFDDVLSEEDAAELVVFSGANTVVNASLAEGGTISGKVTAEDGGAELEGITVSVYNDDGGFGAETDGSGDFSLVVPPGSYLVLFEDFGGTYVPEFFDDALSEEDATEVVVDDADDAEVADAALAEGGSLSGTVVEDGTGSPLSSIQVGVFDPAGNLVRGTMTDGSGNYVVENLKPGSYRVGFLGTATHFGESFDGKPDLAGADPVTVNAGA